MLGMAQKTITVASYYCNFISLLHSGYYEHSAGNRGTRGYYWSSNSNSSTESFGLRFSSTDLSLQYGGGRGYGLAIRCLARQPCSSNIAFTLFATPLLPSYSFALANIFWISSFIST